VPGTRAAGAGARLLPWIVVAIALHSAAVGVVLLLATDWSTRFGGWGVATPRFFVRQFGVFHFVVAAAYLIEYFRYGGVRILLTAKAIAVASLVDATWRFGGPWAVPFAAAGDAAMGLVVWWLARGVGAAPLSAVPPARDAAAPPRASRTPPAPDRSRP
jgi:hypothetical protein